MPNTLIGIVDDQGRTARAVRPAAMAHGCCNNSAATLETFRPGCEASEAELIEHSKALIACHKKPGSVVVVENIPKLFTGKIDKVSLRKEVV